MIKKIIWVLMLLIMTACTILFKDGVDIVLSELTPTAESTLESLPEDGELAGTQMVVPTIEPTLAVSPTQEPTPAAEASAEPEATPIPFDAEYVVQPGSPVYLDNFAHPSEGCDWQGVAGQVFGANGEPVNNLIVKVSGEWDDKEVAIIGVTGMVAGLPYGPGSFEIVLGNKAVKSSAPLLLQIYDQAQKPLTEPFPISTKADCKKNLLIINFVAN